jgi:hypothetical protein
MCYERAEPLCYSLHRPMQLYVALIGRWRHSLYTDRMTVTMQMAERVYSLAQTHTDSGLMIGACRPLACTFYFLGNFEAARLHAMRGVEIWRSGVASSGVEEPIPPAVSCHCLKAVSEWHLGELVSCNATIAEAISLAHTLKDMHALATALWYAASLAHFQRNPTRVESFVTDLIDVCTRHGFVYWQAGGVILHGWARGASQDPTGGISLIEGGIHERQLTGSMLSMPYFLALKAETLNLADRTFEAVEAIREAEAVVERYEERSWCAELHRLRGVFLAHLNAREAEIEDAFHKAIRTAEQQKSASLATRAKATYVEYRRHKASGLGESGFRLPLC